MIYGAYSCVSFNLARATLVVDCCEQGDNKHTGLGKDISVV